MKSPTQNSRRRGFTLIEVAIAGLVVAIVGISIIAGLVYGIQVQQNSREFNGASRAAESLLEQQKRQLFLNLKPVSLTNQVIDDRGTTATTDDVLASVRLQFFRMNGTEVGVAGNAIPLDKSMIRARVTVTWQALGRRGAKTQTLVTTALLAP